MVRSYNSFNFIDKNFLSVFLFLIFFACSAFYSGSGKTIYEEIDYVNSLPCSQSNIDAILRKLKNRYEEEFAFLSKTRKFVSFSPYLYFILRCVPIEKISKEIKNTSYLFKRNIMFLKHAYIVENHLRNCIDPVEYNFGHYKGQHERIWRLPNKRWVFMILKDIISNPEHPYIISEIDIHYYRAMRIMAVDALSETKYNRKKVIRFLKKLVSIQRFQNNINNTDLYDLTHPALMSLGILGEKEFVNSYIIQLQFLQQVYMFQGLPHLFYYIHSRIADLYVYTGQYKEALQYFRALLFIADETVFYNMACLFSLMGEKKRALAMLKKAIKAGYSDLRWLKRDKELDSIRNTRTFKRIIKQLEKKLRER